MQRIAVLGDRAPRDIDAVGTQHFHDTIVRQHLFGRFAVDQHLDAVAHRLGRVHFAARGGAHPGGEEILQLEDTARRGDVLVGGDAAHRAFVQLDLLGDVVEDQRLEVRHPVAEEVLLLAHDFRSHLEDRRGPLVEGLHQPARRVQPLLEVGLVLLAVGSRRDLGVIAAVDQHTR